jgi:hypothetical protein
MKVGATPECIESIGGGVCAPGCPGERGGVGPTAFVGAPPVNCCARITPRGSATRRTLSLRRYRSTTGRANAGCADAARLFVTTASAWIRSRGSRRRR